MNAPSLADQSKKGQKQSKLYIVYLKIERDRECHQPVGGLIDFFQLGAQLPGGRVFLSKIQAPENPLKTNGRKIGNSFCSKINVK